MMHLYDRYSSVVRETSGQPVHPSHHLVIIVESKGSLLDISIFYYTLVYTKLFLGYH